ESFGEPNGGIATQRMADQDDRERTAAIFANRVRGYTPPNQVGIDAGGQTGAVEAFRKPVETSRVDEGGNGAEQIDAGTLFVPRRLCAQQRFNRLDGFAGLDRGNGLDRLRLVGGARKQRVVEGSWRFARWRRRRSGLPAGAIQRGRGVRI